LYYFIQALGGIGRIKDIDQDGDVHVKILDKTWVFSPVCIMALQNPDDASQIPAIPAAKSVDSNSNSMNSSKNGT
jgi:hypothetical protein